MSKTFKLSLIFLLTAVNLVVFRMVFSLLELSDNIANWLFSALFQVLAMGVLPYLMYRFMIGKDIKNYALDMKLKAKIHPVTYIIAVGIGIMVYVLNSAISTAWYVFLNMIDYTYISSVGTIYSSPEVLVFEIITSCMLPAIFEELTDRGLLLASLEGSGLKDMPKVIIVGVFFGLLHQNVTQFGPTIFGGLVMAYMAVKCNSIYPTMIVHFINNFIITIYDYSSQTGGYFASVYDRIYNNMSLIAYVGVIALAAVILFLLLRILKLINAKNNKVQEVKVAEEPQQTPEQNAIPTDVYTTGADEFFNTVVSNNIQRANAGSSYGNYVCAKEKTDLPEVKVPKERQARRPVWEYGMLIAAVVLTLITTVYTFIWGIIR